MLAAATTERTSSSTGPHSACRPRPRTFDLWPPTPLPTPCRDSLADDRVALLPLHPAPRRLLVAPASDFELVLLVESPAALMPPRLSSLPDSRC